MVQSQRGVSEVRPVTFGHQARFHQGLGNILISGKLAPGISIDDFCKEKVVCHEALGGLLKHYERMAA